MSYLTLAKGIPDFSKAVISLWFRAPKESVVAAANHSVATDKEGFSILAAMLPLVTFGKPQQNKNYFADPKIDVGVGVDAPYIPGSPSRMRSPGWSSQGNYDVEPCMIGLICLNNGTFSMVFNIQTNVEMQFGQTSFVTTRIDDYDNTKVPPPYSGPLGINGWLDNYSQTFIKDASEVDNEQPAFFYVQTIENFQPDQWHHVLLSFDVSGVVSLGNPFASSTCRMWYAIDDKDYRGQDHMGPNRGAAFGGGSNVDELGDNTILTYKLWRLSGPPSNKDAGFVYDAHKVSPSGTYAGGSDAIPSNDAPMGIPSSLKYVDGIFRCEMAELQMWTGVTLDTGVENNRRAFVSSDGKPVKPTEGATEDDPRGRAEKLLGKKPDVMLHKSGNWKIGRNTGSTGIEINSDGEETIRPSGQFTPTAKIERYKPDPSLPQETPTA